MSKVFEVNEKCKDCNGTGLFVGMAERDGAAVVCHTCNGTGCHVFRHVYEDFTSRQTRECVKRVYEVNPGIVIGTGRGHKLEDFGGMPVADWFCGKAFVAGMENRKFTCPKWWYQSADNSKAPDWDECWDCLGGSFSGCLHFGTKDKCWLRWDNEQQQKGGE